MRPHCRSGHQADRGMTLIEVMVAISLLGIMAMLVYSSLVITLKSQQRAEILQERYHAARVFLQRIKRELSMSFVSLHQAEDQRTRTLFDGESDRVTFNTSAYEPIRRNAHESDQLEVEYLLGRDEDGERAIIRRAKLHIDDRAGKGGDEEIVIRGVADFELAYYDEDKEDWRDEWEVIIDDAVEKRALLKQVSAQREAVEGLRDDASSGVAGVAAAAGLDKLLDSAQGQVLEDIFLPTRIRIHLVIEDEDGREYVLETQTELRVLEPLWY